MKVSVSFSLDTEYYSSHDKENGRQVNGEGGEARVGRGGKGRRGKARRGEWAAGILLRE